VEGSRPLRGFFQRVVEAQFRNSTRKLVDSDAEQALLEELIDRHAKLPVPAGFERLHFLLYTPFRHPPLQHGSRFGTRAERGILYGARELPVALAEVAYYRLLFLDGPRSDLGPLAVELTSFSFGIRARRAADLCVEARISSKTSYQHSQRRGRELREAGVQACLYLSARSRPPGVCVAVFDDVFDPRQPRGERRWSCTASRALVEFRSQHLLGPDQRFSFARGQFEVAGRLPAPGVD
jgi:hypothetical protein